MNEKVLFYIHIRKEVDLVNGQNFNLISVIIIILIVLSKSVILSKISEKGN